MTWSSARAVPDTPMMFTRVVPLPQLIVSYPEQVYALFFGLILASIVEKETGQPSERPLIAVMEQVEKPGNLGALLRSADLVDLVPTLLAGLHRLSNDLILANSYHCSRYNTNTGRLTGEMFEDVFREIRRLL